jgi:Fe-S cluster biogenesis protein NfuA
LKGACVGCPMSALTLKQGVERLIKQKIPEVKSVEAVQ